MPNRKTHQRVGVVVGGGATLLATKDLPPEARLAALVGGLVGGYMGGTLPDILEPALHSWHRGECHSAAACVGVIATGVKTPELASDFLTRAAEINAQRVALPENHPDRLGLWFQEFGLYVIYGAMLGFSAGYASHLILDLGTKRGIPFLGKGF